MDADRDTARIVRSWLEEGRTRLPDRILDAVLDELPATRQRRGMWVARRLPYARMPIRLTAAAAAIVAALVVGTSLLAGGFVGGVGGFGPGGVASTHASPSPGPTPLALGGDWQPLQAGATYVTPDPFPMRITFKAPPRWFGNVGGPYAVFLGTGAEDTIWFQRFDTLYADPCHPDRGTVVPQVGPSVGDLATALSNLPGLSPTRPTDTTFAGYPAKQLTLTAPDDLAGCTGGIERVWLLPLGATNDMTPGESIRVWILDVAGQRLVVSALKLPQELPADLATIQAVLDSVRIEASR